KMLYDNALLASAYLEASLLRDEPRWRAVGRTTLDYLLREMQAPGGGFWSSQDAQSEGVEGRFFVWTRDQVEAVLGDRADEVCRVFGVTDDGNWEHTNVLSLVSDAPATDAFAAARAELFAARAERVRPATDEKVLLAWNGLAIEAMCDGYRVLGDARYLDAARRAADFLLARCVRDGRVRRSWQGGAAPLPGYLDDHGAFANALLSLFECDGEPRWLAAAKAVLDVTVQRFGAADGSFYFTADDHEQLLARTKNAGEGATPSGVAMATLALLRAGLLLGDRGLYDRGVDALRANHALLAANASAAPSLMRAVQFHLGRPREIVVAGDPAAEPTAALLRAAWRRFPQPGVVALVHDDNRAALLALSEVFVGKQPKDGVAAAYVCERGVCQAPVTDAADLRAALGAGR
ncbi:MAG: thioredoxin domain-containing protein, partial [Planctomycetes bacterium]|nr:thioredoxin domain-containing protein [Planctomycetota bacterium]